MLHSNISKRQSKFSTLQLLPYYITTNVSKYISSSKLNGLLNVPDGLVGETWKRSGTTSLHIAVYMYYIKHCWTRFSRIGFSKKRHLLISERLKILFYESSKHFSLWTLIVYCPSKHCLIRLEIKSWLRVYNILQPGANSDQLKRVLSSVCASVSASCSPVLYMYVHK